MTPAFARQFMNDAEYQAFLASLEQAREGQDSGASDRFRPQSRVSVRRRSCPLAGVHSSLRDTGQPLHHWRYQCPPTGAASRDPCSAITLPSRPRQQIDMARQQMRLFDMEYAAREEQRDYYRNMDEINRAILQNERDTDMQRMLRTDAQLASERDFYINRQMDLDRDAAAERARQLRQLINNQMLAASEQDVALDELKRAQEIAAGERETDLRNFHEAQFQARAERQFAIEQMEQKQFDCPS